MSLRYLTHKLKSQTISDVMPGLDNEKEHEQVEFPADVESESEAESDDENAEICSIIEGSRHGSISRGSENQKPDRPGSTTICMVDKIPPDQPLRSGSSFQEPIVQAAVPQEGGNLVGVGSPMHPRTPLRTMQPDNTPYEDPAFGVVASDGAADSSKAGRDASQEKMCDSSEGGMTAEGSKDMSGDMVRCFCPDAPANSLHPMPRSEGRSSVEELEMINCCPAAPFISGEKRKWSSVVTQWASTSSCSSGGSFRASSGDDEMQDLTSPINFSCSPPKGLKGLQRVEMDTFLAEALPLRGSPSNLWISPRKRQRHGSVESDGEGYIQRPYLDLEKMQRSTVKIRNSPHNMLKAKIVKIKTINANSRSPKPVPDPEIFSFQSISTNHLSPMEEPFAF